jgi:hypothetical protein
VIFGHVPMLDAAQITEAVHVAQNAFTAWRWMPVAKRAALLLRWHEQISRHQNDPAAILSLEQGKPLVHCVIDLAPHLCSEPDSGRCVRRRLGIGLRQIVLLLAWSNEEARDAGRRIAGLVL